VKPGEVEMFHDQIGYWLWEPAAKLITFTLAIPRGQVLLASGHAEPDAAEFEITATAGAQHYGILSNPFLDRGFRTVSFRMLVSVNSDGTWSYDETTMMELPGLDELFPHRDQNTFTQVSSPSPNPMALAN
jgi:hypothetical protein